MQVLNTFNTTVEKALSEIDSRWRDLPGLVVCGTHSPININQMLIFIREARETAIPILGICSGLQLCLIEFARSVLNIDDANTTEIDLETKNPIFIKLPQLRVGAIEVEGRQESHWHNYTFNKIYKRQFEDAGWRFVLKDDIVEIARYGQNVICTQFHPEYGSSKDSIHPLLKEFIKICHL